MTIAPTFALSAVRGRVSGCEISLKLKSRRQQSRGAQPARTLAVLQRARGTPALSSSDSDRLKALIVEQHFQLISHDNEIENLKLLILKLRPMQFGPSSERLARHIDQLE
jgi:hypothetical protein